MRKTGLFALMAVGVFYAWRNRYRIQHFLESRGINLPIDASNLRNALKSGYSKVTGSVEQGREKVRQAG